MDSGTDPVRFNDEVVDLRSSTDAYKLGLRFIHQELNIIPAYLLPKIFLSAIPTRVLLVYSSIGVNLIKVQKMYYINLVWSILMCARMPDS